MHKWSIPPSEFVMADGGYYIYFNGFSVAQMSEAVYFAVLILIIVLIVKGCSGGTDVLKGKWDLDGTTAYEFSGDGNGALLLPNVTYEFSYDIKKDQISIDYENESVRDGTYTFTVEDNTLTLIGGEGTVGDTYTLTRVEEEQPPI